MHSPISRPRSARRRVHLILLGPLLGLMALAATSLAPAATLAHPLDVYLLGSYVTVTPTQVEVELDATPGVLLAPDVLKELDANGDGAISDDESQAYVQAIVDAMQVSVDGTPLTLAITRIEMPSYLNIQAGYGLIRIYTSAELPESATAAGATASLSYVNGFTPTGAMYQVNTFTSGTTPIGLGTQQRSDDQQRLDVQFAIDGTVAAADSGSPATSTTTTTTTVTTSAGGWLGNLLAYLERPNASPAALAVALGLAMVLGGIHALTPGHGKTLVAAYLVGNKGTVRHAAALGATVTLTHTLSVVAIGLVALFASHLLVPGILVPGLQVLSGLLVVILAAKLAWQRWQAPRLAKAGITVNAHTHAGASGGHVHHHGDGKLHSHAVPEGPLTARSLVAMGVSGGLVPCPEALGIMILAVGLNHIALGLGLIVAFSLGLASVLIGLGILLVRSRTLLDKVGTRGGAVQRWLPLASAGVVLVLGVGIVLKGLASIDGVTLPSTPALAGIALLLLMVAALGVTAWTRVRRSRPTALPAGTTPTALVPLAMLPPRYQDGHPVSSAPMSAAPLVYDATGEVAWDRIWGHDDPDQPFCHLALAGGPPHRGTLLEPNPDFVANARVKDLDAVRAELERGLRMVTGLPVTRNVESGWIGLVCPDAEAAAWLAQAINAENVRARLDGTTILLPADPSFRTEAEIKNVVTATAKTYHYWSEHAAATALPNAAGASSTRTSWSLPMPRWAWK